MKHKQRLAQLEKWANERPVHRITEIEIVKSYEDGHTVIETHNLDEETQTKKEKDEK